MLVVPERVGDGGLRSLDARIEEAAGLAEAIGIEIVARRAFRLRQVRPASLFGKGQAEEIAGLALNSDVYFPQSLAETIEFDYLRFLGHFARGRIRRA